MGMYGCLKAFLVGFRVEDLGFRVLGLGSLGFRVEIR